MLAESSSISDMQLAYRVLNALGVWLPVLALVLLAAGIALAGDRRRALLRGSFGIVAADGGAGRPARPGAGPLRGVDPGRDPHPRRRPGACTTTLVRFLRSGLRYVGVLFLIVGLARPGQRPLGRCAVRTRQTLAGGIGSVRRSAAGAGFRTGGFGTVAARAPADCCGWSSSSWPASS